MKLIETKSLNHRGLLDAYDEADRAGFPMGTGKWIVDVDLWPKLARELDPLGQLIAITPDVDTAIGTLFGRPLILSRKPEYRGKAVLFFA